MSCQDIPAVSESFAATVAYATRGSKKDRLNLRAVIASLHSPLLHGRELMVPAFALVKGHFSRVAMLACILLIITWALGSLNAT
jgi:hypothetical protein